AGKNQGTPGARRRKFAARSARQIEDDLSGSESGVGSAGRQSRATSEGRRQALIPWRPGFRPRCPNFSDIFPGTLSKHGFADDSVLSYVRRIEAGTNKTYRARLRHLLGCSIAGL